MRADERRRRETRRKDGTVRGAEGVEGKRGRRRVERR